MLQAVPFENVAVRRVIPAALYPERENRSSPGPNNSMPGSGVLPVLNPPQVLVTDFVYLYIYLRLRNLFINLQFLRYIIFTDDMIDMSKSLYIPKEYAY